VSVARTDTETGTTRSYFHVVVPGLSVALMLTRRDITRNFYSQIQVSNLVEARGRGYV
jgi:hypothetical protein